MTIMLPALVALAGGSGAAARFMADGLIRSRLTTTLPVSTVFINVTGSLLLGLLAGLALSHHIPDELRVILGVGFLGGYTTFSTANVETVSLIHAGYPGKAIINALGTMVLTVFAAGSGLGLGMLW